MKTRRFGRNDLQVSQVVFGAGYVGGIIVLADDDTRRRVLRFSLANPDLACVVIGLAEPSHLEEAIAGEAMGPLPAEAIGRLEAVYVRGFA